MDTLEFLKTILPEEGIKIVGVASTDFTGLIQKPFTSFEEMAAAILELDQNPKYTVYHACSAFSEECLLDDEMGKATRGGKHTIRQKAFWLDIDCGPTKGVPNEDGVIKGYLTKSLGAAALKEFCNTVGLPYPMIVDSGNGLHCYWPLTKSIPMETWWKIATVFKDITIHAGLIADPTATCDRARVLRPVGTFNKKKDERKLVKLMRPCEPIEAREFARIVSKYEAENELNVTLPRDNSLNDDLTAHLAPPPSIPAFADLVAEKCAQVAQMRDSGGDVSYEHWRGVIGILKYCEDGEAKAHEWSSGHETYNENDTQQRFDTWSTPPTTCEFFSKCNPSKCEGCPSKGKVKTPIVLGRKEPEQEATEVEAAVEGKQMVVEIPKPPPGYGFEENMMVRFMKDKDDITHAFAFCNNVFYPTHRIHKETGDFSIGIRMHLPDKRVRDFELDTQVLASDHKTVEGLARYELIPTNAKGSAMHMTAYLRDSLERLKREAQELSTHTNFGWQKNHQAFMVGDRLYHKDGTIRKVLVGGYAKDKIANFPTPDGKLEVYADTLNYLYSRPGMEHMQYIVASTFGSLLTPFCDPLYRGICFAIVSSQSGKGKTTACFTGIYAFGDAAKMKVDSDQVTVNALYATIGVHKNIPVLYDEVTNIKPDELSKLCYAVTSGQERQRLTTGGTNGTKFASSQSWEMVVFLTANSNLHSLLASRQSNTEAEAVRLIQLDVDRYPLPELKDEIDEITKRLADNQGVAGEVFVEYLVKNLDDVMKRMRVWSSRFKQDIPEIKYRFYRAQATTAMAALEITNELGITNFELEPVYAFIKKLFFELADTVKEQNSVSSEDAFNRMLNDLQPRILVTNEYRDGRDSRGPEEGNRIVTGAVAGRRIMGNQNTKDNALAGKLYLVKKEAVDWCLSERVDYKGMIAPFMASGVVRDVKEKFNVGRGTKVSAGQHRCIEIDMTKLDQQKEGQTPAPALTIHTGGRIEGSEVANSGV